MINFFGSQKEHKKGKTTIHDLGGIRVKIIGGTKKVNKSMLESLKSVFKSK